MAKATELTYTEKELAAIEVLRANKGTPMSAKDLGIATAILTSLQNKANKFPGEAVVINKTDFNDVCPTCGAKISHKLYEIAE